MNFQDYNFIFHGRIIKYFPETQTATVRICGERLQDSSTTNRSRINRADIEDVPVHTPSGGGWALTFPIKKGDTCLLMFSQQGYDHWLWEDKDTAGSFRNQPMYWLERKFSLKDGFAHVGYNTIPRKIQDYHETDSEWRNEDAAQVIRLKDDLHIEIESPVQVTIIAPVVNVNAETSCNVVSPITTITSNTSCTITSPITNITGVLNVGGALNVSGLLTGIGTMSTPAISINGKPYATHYHTHGGDNTSGPI